MDWDIRWGRNAFHNSPRMSRKGRIGLCLFAGFALAMTLAGAYTPLAKLHPRLFQALYLLAIPLIIWLHSIYRRDKRHQNHD